MKKPYYCHQLARALHLANWLSPVVEHLTEYRDYFANLVDLKKPKAQLKRENESMLWTTEAEAKWSQFLDILNKSSKRRLRNYKPEKPICLFADASDQDWGLMVTHCENCNPGLLDDNTPIRSQVNSPQDVKMGYQFQQVDMVVRHIPGENVAADILSRWGNRYAEEIVKEKNNEMDMVMFSCYMVALKTEINLDDPGNTNEV
eukprot:augustus_masked-scaffold_95-processed-gene-0.33-mRNA-1 protein AED:1.00 eAED:1.00 QI:0/0/0/0/1/1/2/0/202